MAPAHESVACGGLTLHIVTLTVRRGPRPYRTKRWMFLRQLEQCIFGPRDTGTGAMNKLLGRVSMQESTICLGRASVNDGIVTDDDFAFVLDLFRSTITDPEARARVRNVSLCPTSVSSAAAQAFGRCDRTVALLRALSSLPTRWEQEIEREALAKEVRASPAPQTSYPPSISHCLLEWQDLVDLVLEEAIENEEIDESLDVRSLRWLEP